MTATRSLEAPITSPDHFFIGGEWVKPSTRDRIDVVDPATEEVFFRVAEAQVDDVQRAIAAARTAFDEGPWPRMKPTERAEYLRAIAEGLRERSADLAQIWPRQSGVLHSAAKVIGAGAAQTFEYYASLAETFEFEESATSSTPGTFSLLVREPVGVVGAIIPWNAPMLLAAYKAAPALLAGCTVVLKASPEAPGEAYVLAEIAQEVGLPPGVLNVVTADREASERLVTSPDVDKISFTGSTAAGRRIATLCGGRIARYTLELGGKSAAVILDDMDLDIAARQLASDECVMTGQVCASLTRIIVTKDRHDPLVDALAAAFSAKRVGDPFDEQVEMGPLAMRRQLERVQGYVEKGVAEGARLVTGGGRPAGLDRGWFFEPTVFADVDNRSTIAQEEIFGPVLSVIRAEDERDAVRLANDTIYGLNASVFTPDIDRARAVAGSLRSGTVGHNAFRSDFGIAFGGYKQSGVGREGGIEGLRPYLEVKTVILDEAPSEWRG
ncbi:aldehyde dehydrogenase [Mycobacterium sp. UM_CSW]|uniref:aldehyde dehydrogenase n=1 Tax=Mycobacterium sp. UM_CSW TaxID=1370119 RepID=UPI000413BBCE|nr:aldehyde dehydrogenase [Mycobacterium sp. UM_CSW]